MRTIWRLLCAVGLALGLIGCMGLRTPQGSRISGTVVDDQRHPVAKATVEVYQSTTVNQFLPTDMKLTRTVQTDNQGAFELPAFDQGSLLVAHKPGWAPGGGPIGDRRESPLLVVLRSPTEIVGRVVDGNGQPVAGAEVWASAVSSITLLGEGRLSAYRMTGKPARELFKARTAADGRFILDNIPTNGGANLVVTKPGMAMREPILDPDNINLHHTQCLAGERDITLVMEPAGEIQGTVIVPATGRPVGGARLWLQRDHGTFSLFNGREPVTSGPDGTFRFGDLAAGSYHIHTRFGVPADGLPGWVADTIPVLVAAGQTVSGVRIPAIQGGILEITALDQQSRKPLAGVPVTASKRDYQGLAYTSTKGTARLRLPPGEYDFSALKQPWSFAWSKANVENGRSTRHQLQESPPLSLTGTVLDCSGEPAANVRLAVHPYSSDETKTDPHGRFQINWASKDHGLHCLVARDWARNLAAASDIVATSRNLELHLQPGLTLAGQVADEDNRPIAEARLGLTLTLRNSTTSTSTDLDKAPMQTDAHGRFEFAVLPQGRDYSVSVLAKGYGSARRSLKSVETETNRLELRFVLKTANLRLSGRVVDTEGKPLAGAYVTVSGAGQPTRPAQMAVDGHFEFKNLCAGAVQVSAMCQESLGSVKAQAGDTNVLVRIDTKQRSFHVVPDAPLR